MDEEAENMNMSEQEDRAEEVKKAARKSELSTYRELARNALKDPESTYMEDILARSVLELLEKLEETRD
jgi:hypothetical protein